MPRTIDIDLTVTPQNKNGNDVQCSISGPTEFMDGQAIKLPLSEDEYRLKFRLADGGRVKVDWDNGNPFATKKGGGCPDKHEKDDQFHGIQANGDTVTVIANGQDRKSVVHYRMNFADGSSCDPMIKNGFTGPVTDLIINQ